MVSSLGAGSSPLLLPYISPLPLVAYILSHENPGNPSESAMLILSFLSVHGYSMRSHLGNIALGRAKGHVPITLVKLIQVTRKRDSLLVFCDLF
jgi:hypothetical protein